MTMQENLLIKLQQAVITPSSPPPSSAKLAAVIVPIVITEDEPYIYLIQRPSHLYEHGGEVGFPGGKIENFDATPLQAAQREVEEELGIPASLLTVVKELPIHCTLTERYCIHPFIAYMTSTHQLHPNQNEVEAVIKLPLTFLLTDKNWTKESIQRNNHKIVFDVLYYQQSRIWGVSARILLTIKRLLLA